MKRFGGYAQIVELMKVTAFVVIAALVMAFGLWPLPLVHGAPAQKLIKPGHLMIDGFRVDCGKTPALISEQYPDFGAARRGLIILNPAKLRNLPRGAKLLIYYHECAHQHVGGSELAADCWAVQKVRREGLMDRAGLKNACSFIKGLPANRRHPPGKMRCRHMMRCYNETFKRKAKTRGRPDGQGQNGALSSSGFSRPVGNLSKLPAVK